MSEALLFDGQSARARPVDAAIESGVLVIRVPGRGELGRWPLRQLRRAMIDDRARSPLRLRQKGGAAVLVVEDDALIAALLEAAPQLRPVGNPLGRLLWRAGLFSAVSAGFVAALYLGLPLASGPIAKATPYSLERRLGETVEATVTSVFPLCEGSGGTGHALIRTLTERLTPPKWPHEVRTIVLNTRVPNAFALPGGTIAVTSGLLDFLESGDELAAVLAHEIGHVVERHVMAKLVRDLGLYVFLDSVSGGAASASSAITDAAATLTSLSYSRAFEREADRIALERLRAEEISPEGLASFFERIATWNPNGDSSRNRRPGAGADGDEDEDGEAETDAPKSEGEMADAEETGEAGGSGEEAQSPGERIWTLLSTHPGLKERAQRARARAEDWGPTRPALTPGELRNVKRACLDG